MKHEVLFLNNRRAYVLVSDTWYDTPADFAPKPGQSFLAGRIEEVLDYQTYQEKYPDSKDEIYPYVSDKTMTCFVEGLSVEQQDLLFEFVNL